MYKPIGKSSKKTIVPSEPKAKVQGGGTLEPSPERGYGHPQPSERKPQASGIRDRESHLDLPPPFP